MNSYNRFKKLNNQTWTLRNTAFIMGCFFWTSILQTFSQLVLHSLLSAALSTQGDLKNTQCMQTTLLLS